MIARVVIEVTTEEGEPIMGAVRQECVMQTEEDAQSNLLRGAARMDELIEDAATAFRAQAAQLTGAAPTT